MCTLMTKYYKKYFSFSLFYLFSINHKKYKKRFVVHYLLLFIIIVLAIKKMISVILYDCFHISNIRFYFGHH